MSKNEKIIKVDGMTCQHCVDRVKKALENLDGVQKAIVDLNEGVATIIFEGNIDNKTLIDAIVEEGYKASI